MIAVLLAAWTWKSTALALIALLAARLARGRAPADRAGLLRLVVLALLILPVVRLAFPWQLNLGMPQDLGAPVAALGGPGASGPPSGSAPGSLTAGSIAGAALDGPTILDLLYLAGLIFLAARLLLGIRTLRQWTARAERVENPEWQRALGEAAAAMGARPPRLLVSRDVPGPLSWGFFRPVVLVDEASMRRTDEAAAILLHELAHVVRHDWIVLILARIAVALFWFNPLVWLLARMLADETESAADRRAARELGTTLYARLLVDYARQSWFSPVPALTIASTRRRLSKRIRALLDDDGRAPAGLAARIAMTVAATGPAFALAATAVVIPLTTSVLVGASGDNGRPVPARRFFPYLARYYAFPPGERSKVELTYRFTVDGRPANRVGLMLGVGGRLTRIPLNADGWAQRLPSAADLDAGAAVVASPTPGQPVKVDIRPNLQTSITPAREISAADCALAVSQVNGGAKRVMGLLGFFLSKVRAISFPGAGSGVAILADGRTVKLPQLNGSPAYDPQALPSARLIRLARTPTIVDLDTET